ncbi:MAG: hypothetical protein R6W73_07940 [Candidatus Saliniplasma sp.]
MTVATYPTCVAEDGSSVVASSTVTVLLMSEEVFFVQERYSFFPALMLSTNLENLGLSNIPILYTTYLSLDI